MMVRLLRVVLVLFVIVCTTLACCSLASADYPLLVGPSQSVAGFPASTGCILNYVSPDGQDMLLQVWNPVWRSYSASWNPATQKWGPVDASGTIAPVDLGFPNWTGGATLSPDKQTMYYGDGTTYVSRSRYTTSGWTLPPEKVLNTVSNPTSTYFNGFGMYMTQYYDNLYVSEYQPGTDTFAPPTPVDSINLPGYKVNSAWVSTDNSLMIFSSDRPGGLGGFDLWSSVRDQGTGSWTNITNLGPNVNSTSDEYTPRLTEFAPQNTLYFDRRLPSGEYQLMESPVPEPSTLLLLGMGAVSLIFVWHRRNRAN